MTQVTRRGHPNLLRKRTRVGIRVVMLEHLMALHTFVPVISCVVRVGTHIFLLKVNSAEWRVLDIQSKSVYQIAKSESVLGSHRFKDSIP